MPRTFALLWPVLLAGCLTSPKTPSGDDTAGLDDGDDTGGDTGAAAIPCGSYHRVGELGAVTDWVWYGGGGSLSTEVAWDPASGIATTEATTEQYAEDHVEVASVTIERRCDADGLWAHRSYAEWTRTYEDGSVSTGWTETTYTNTLMAVPALVVGTSWGSVGTQTVVEEVDGVALDPVTDETSSDVTAVAETSLTVEAGTFDVLEVTGTARGRPTTYWVSSEVGVVRNEGGELRAFSAP